MSVSVWDTGHGSHGCKAQWCDVVSCEDLLGSIDVASAKARGDHVVRGSLHVPVARSG